MSIGVFAGSFDPFTIGHFEIARRAAALFDTLYIGIALNNGGKLCKADIDTRKEIVHKSIETLKNVKVEIFDGFLTEFAASVKADCIVRGLRTAMDFEYEKSLMEVYKSQSDVECAYIISGSSYSHVSGAVVRELVALKGSVKGYVQPEAESLICKAYSKK